jgi:hypothetical protein
MKRIVAGNLELECPSCSHLFARRSWHNPLCPLCGHANPELSLGEEFCSCGLAMTEDPLMQLYRLPCPPQSGEIKEVWHRHPDPEARITSFPFPGKNLLLVLVLSIAYSILAAPASAKVTGVCATCHTMHNSQDGSVAVQTGTGTGWSAAGALSDGSPSDTPVPRLLITDCVGCHSSTSDQTIIELGETRIPIVFNTNQYPAKPLAGGNFYNVSRGEAYDGYGHNVYGIAELDARLSAAPGNTRCSGTKRQ